MKKFPKAILLIAYLFPPIGGSGAIRPVKISKYLPENGWTPFVLTVKTSDYYYAYDPELIDSTMEKARVIRSYYFKSSWVYRILNPIRNKKIDLIIRKYIFHPDEQIGWVPFAFISAVKLIRKHKIQALYSTSGPLTCHLIAYLVKKFTGIPWVAEFRDEWFEDPELCFPTKIHRKYHYFLEKHIVNYADRIITMAPVFGKLLGKHQGNSDKISTIVAGYDLSDGIFINPNDENRDPKFRLVFTGLFYESFRPTILLRAIEALIEDGKVLKEHAIVQFVGANNPVDLGAEDKYGIFKFEGFVPRRKIPVYFSEADALLLLLSRKRGKDVIPSKIFEYMAANKPILAVIPEDGDAARIIRKTKTGIIADFEKIEDVKRAYFELYSKWKNKEPFAVADSIEVKKYNQAYLFRKLSEIINEVSL